MKQTMEHTTGFDNTSPTQSKYLPWLVWGIAALFYCYENFLQVSLNVIAPELQQTFNLSAAALGGLFSYYFITYAGMQIPVGLLLDKYGPRVILCFAATVVGLGSLLFGIAPVFGLTVLGRLLIGFGSAFAIVSCFKLVSVWFPLERFALVSGLTITIGFSGSIIGDYPFAVLADVVGWRVNMIAFSLIGFVIAFFVWKLVRPPVDAPKHSIAASSHHSEVSLLSGLKMVVANPRNWLIAIYGSLMFAPTLAFGPSWGGVFMVTAYHVDMQLGVAIASALYVGWIVGAPAFGWLSDTIRRRKPSLYIASVGALLTFTPVLFFNHLPLPMVAFLLFLAGFFSSGFLPSFSIIREMNPSKVSATGMGFMNTMNSLGGVFAPYLIGQMLDWHWNGLMDKGVRVYQVSDYHVALVLIPVMLLASIVILPWIPETHCKTHH